MLSAVKKAAEDGSPGTSILIGFKFFLPNIFIIFFFLFFILIALGIFDQHIFCMISTFFSSIISVIP